MGLSSLPIGQELGTRRHVAHPIPLPPFLPTLPIPAAKPAFFLPPQGQSVSVATWCGGDADWLTLLSGHRLRLVHHPTHTGLGQGWVFNPLGPTSMPMAMR